MISIDDYISIYIVSCRGKTWGSHNFEDTL